MSRWSECMQLGWYNMNRLASAVSDEENGAPIQVSGYMTPSVGLQTSYYGYTPNFGYTLPVELLKTVWEANPSYYREAASETRRRLHAGRADNLN
eukprot:364600-Chlamydomonas_euryale.AAC.12